MLLTLLPRVTRVNVGYVIRNYDLCDRTLPESTFSDSDYVFPESHFCDLAAFCECIVTDFGYVFSKNHFCDFVAYPECFIINSGHLVLSTVDAYGSRNLQFSFRNGYISDHFYGLVALVRNVILQVIYGE